VAGYYLFIFVISLITSIGYEHSTGMGMGLWTNFHRAMHYSAKRGIETACRLSVCLSVRLWRWWIRITYAGNLGN